MTCIFLCALFITSRAQSNVADSLAAQGHTDRALLEYERIIFESTDATIHNAALYKKALLYKNQGRHAEALKTLERANLFFTQDSLTAQIREQIALTAYLSGNYAATHAQLLQIKHFFPTSYEKMHFLHVLALNNMAEWPQAKNVYQSYYDQHPGMALSPDEAYGFIENNKFKDPEKAEKISYFLPGVGQMYAGYFWKGLISSGIQAALIGYGAYGLYQGYFFTGALAGVGLFYAFYTGGARHAGYLAHKRNEQLREEYTAPIQKAILEIENMSK